MSAIEFRRYETCRRDIIFTTWRDEVAQDAGDEDLLFALTGRAHIYTLAIFFEVVQLLSFAWSKTNSIHFNDPHDLALLHHVCTLLGAACGGHWCVRTGGYDTELSLGCAELISSSAVKWTEDMREIQSKSSSRRQRRKERNLCFPVLFSSLHSPSVSLGTLWPLVCMANHTIVLITASQLAPSKGIRDTARTHTHTGSFPHRCAHSYELTVSSLAVNQIQIHFVWGIKDPIAKLKHTFWSYLLERAVYK